MKLDELKNKKILILGYGKEGKSTERFLKEKIPDLKVDATDKTIDPDYLSKQKDYDLVIKTPGIPKHLVTVPYTTATNIFFANTNNLIIGVTGTKGKSTTASLIYSILKQAGENVRLVGNIGNPMLDELGKGVNPEEIFVIELSSYQLDDIHYSPHIAVIVSLFPDHMNYHGNIENYYEAKHNLIRFVKENDYFVYNDQNQILSLWAKQAVCKTIPFDIDIPVAEQQLPLIGEHNKKNIQAAITIARILNIKDEIIATAIKSFKPLPHRLQNVGTFRGITFYDDAISTTPESTIAAINSFEKIGTIFLGGEDRGYDFSKLIELLIKRKISNIVLFPDSRKRILESLRVHAETLPNILQTENMEEAVRFAYENTPVGTICLLSTASPSYSLWKDFQEKGDLFQSYVKQVA
ncbi:MAG: UDP-N-acetylmuramoyl-L-alanine--D-glutamate ligase [Candidatus Roizmanbacteria bacterium]|nr:MAG: UDP-N-acetylmuramoyl-L-alanine--D-glutamate ligase [Candidatus Roizmanbacteria bacterium]